MKIFEKILKDTLESYLLLEGHELLQVIESPNYRIKERLATIKDLQVIIYSNDHDPPHFHVKTKDLKIDAKFKIEDCSLLSGDISRKNLKKIRAFHQSPKGKIVMKKIWNKKEILK